MNVQYAENVTFYGNGKIIECASVPGANICHNEQFSALISMFCHIN